MFLLIFFFFANTTVLAEVLSSFQRDPQLDFSKRSLQSEKKDRNVDIVALNVKMHGIELLKNLLGTAQSGDREKELMIKIIESLHEAAIIAFRVAHGKSSLQLTAIDFSSYQKLNEELIKYASEFSHRFPHHEDIDEVFFLKAAAHEELMKIDSDFNIKKSFFPLKEIEQKNDEELIQYAKKKNPKAPLGFFSFLLAQKYYLKIISTYPHSRFTLSCYLALGEFCYETQQYQNSIYYYAFIIQMQQIKTLPLALYKTAWAYYELSEVKFAIDNMIENYKTLKRSQNQAEPNGVDLALQEKALKDCALFYFKGANMGLKAFSYENAASFFSAIEKSDQLGIMLFQFANLLRMEQKENELLHLNDQCIKLFPQLTATYRIIGLTAEMFFLKGNTEKVKEACRKITFLSRSIEPRSLEKLQNSPFLKDWLNIANSLYQKIEKTENNEAHKKSIQKNREVIAEIDKAYLLLAIKNAPQTFLTHYNLALTLEMIQQIDSATQEYRILSLNWDKAEPALNADKTKKRITKAMIDMHVCKTRYISLIEKNLIPKTITPLLFSQVKKKEMNEKVKEWIEWVDNLDKIAQNDPDKDAYVFETNRLYYAHGDIKTCFSRIKKFAQNSHGSSFTLEGISLIIDTYLLNQSWEEAINDIDFFLPLLEKEKSPSFTDFCKKIKMISSESFFSLIEKTYKEKNIEKTQKNLALFFEKYPENEKTSQALLLSAQIEWNKKNAEDAQTSLKKLLAREKKHSLIKPARLLLAQINTASFDYQSAFENYFSYLIVSDDQDATKENARIRMIALRNLIDGKKPDMSCENQKIWKNPEPCYASFALDQIVNQKTAMIPEKIKKNASIKTQALFLLADSKAFIATPSPHLEKEIKSTLFTLKNILKSFYQLDPLYRYEVTPFFVRFVSQTINQLHQAMRMSSPLELKAELIEKRARLLTDFEQILSQISSEGLAQLHLMALTTNAIVHSEFVLDIEKLGVSKTLLPEERKEIQKEITSITLPLKQKIANINQTAANLIKNSFFDPVQMEPILTSLNMKPLSFSPESCSSKLSNSEKELSYDWISPSDQTEKTLNQIFSAIKKNHFAEAIFLLSELDGIIKEPENTLVNALILDQMGCHPEAMQEIYRLDPHLKISKKIFSVLISNAVLRGAEKQAHQLCTEFTSQKKGDSK